MRRTASSRTVALQLILPVMVALHFSLLLQQRQEPHQKQSTPPQFNTIPLARNSGKEHYYSEFRESFEVRRRSREEPAIGKPRYALEPGSNPSKQTNFQLRIATTTRTNSPQHLLRVRFQQTTEIVYIIPSKWMQSPELSSRHPSQILIHNFPAASSAPTAPLSALFAMNSSSLRSWAEIPRHKQASPCCLRLRRVS